jgi:hypothetical protein
VTIVVLTRIHAPATQKTPEFVSQLCPSEDRGHRECRCTNAPAALRAKVKKHASKSPQARRNIRHSLRDGAAAYTCSPRCPGLLATVAGVMRKHRRQRNPSVGRSGPHDFAARLEPRSSCAAHSVHRIPRPTSVTIAIRPSFRARDGRASKGDLPDGARGISAAEWDDGRIAQDGYARCSRARSPFIESAFVELFLATKISDSCDEDI